MPLETQKPQGQDEQLYTPPGPQPIVFEDFSGGLNTNSTRPGIKDQELWWSDGFFPIAPNYLRTIPDVGPPIYDPSLGPNPPAPPQSNLLWLVGGSCEVLVMSISARNTDPPLRDIQGMTSELEGPTGNADSESFSLWIGSDGTCYHIGGYIPVTGWINNIAVFAPGADGDIAPTQFISGSSTGLGSTNPDIAGICIDGSKNIYAGIFNQILKFTSGSTGDVAGTVVATFGAGETITSLFFDATKNLIWISSIDGSLGSPGAVGYVRAINLSGTVENTITGATTTMRNPYQVYLDAHRVIYVADENSTNFDIGPGVISIFPSDSDGDISPATQFSSDNISLGPTGVAVDSNGNIYVTITNNTDLGVVEIYPPGTSGLATPSGMMDPPEFLKLNDGSSTFPRGLMVTP